MPFEDVESDWLDFLQGKSPLLSRPEVEYIAEVRRSIIQESKSQASFPRDRHLKHKLSVMKNNFSKVAESLKENLDSKNYFLNKYPQWRTVRDQTVLQLKEIAKCVNKDSQESTAVQGLGSTVSLVGGLICLATGGVALRLLGTAFMGLGTLTSAGASVIQVDSLEKNLKKAEKIIKEDIKYSEKLWDWMNELSFIQGALDTIRNINIDDNLKKAADDFHASYKAKNNEWKMMIEKGLGFFNFSSQTRKEVAEVVGILIATHMLYDRYRLYFNVVFEVYKRNKILSVAFDVALSSLKIQSSIFNVKNKKLTTFQKSTILTGMVLDVISIIRASENTNATSQEAEKITEAAKKLEEEAREFQKLYYELRIL